MRTFIKSPCHPIEWRLLVSTLLLSKQLLMASMPTLNEAGSSTSSLDAHDASKVLYLDPWHYGPETLANFVVAHGCAIAILGDVVEDQEKMVRRIAELADVTFVYAPDQNNPFVRIRNSLVSPSYVWPANAPLAVLLASHREPNRSLQSAVGEISVFMIHNSTSWAISTAEDAALAANRYCPHYHGRNERTLSEWAPILTPLPPPSFSPREHSEVCDEFTVSVYPSSYSSLPLSQEYYGMLETVRKLPFYREDWTTACYLLLPTDTTPRLPLLRGTFQQFEGG